MEKRAENSALRGGGAIKMGRFSAPISKPSIKIYTKTSVP